MKTIVSLLMLVALLTVESSAAADPSAGARAYVSLEEGKVRLLSQRVMAVFLSGRRAALVRLVGDALQACEDLEAARAVTGVKARKSTLSTCELLGNSFQSAGQLAPTGEQLMVSTALEMAARQVGMPPSAAVRLQGYRYGSLAIIEGTGEVR